MSDRPEHEPSAHNDQEGAHAEAIHLPGPSYWPLVLSVCLVVAVAGMMVSPLITVAGGLAAFGSIVAWGLEDTSQ